MIGGKAPFKAVHCAIFCALPRHLFSVAWSAPVIEGVERREQILLMAGLPLAPIFRKCSDF